MRSALRHPIAALALAHPRAVEVDADIDGRPSAPVESAVYFAVAEVLTNSAKHAAAQNSWVWMRHDGAVLTVIDAGLLRDHDWVHFHPLVNSMTTAIRPAALLRFLEGLGHRLELLELHGGSA